MKTQTAAKMVYHELEDFEETEEDITDRREIREFLDSVVNSYEL